MGTYGFDRSIRSVLQVEDQLLKTEFTPISVNNIRNAFAALQAKVDDVVASIAPAFNISYLVA